MPASVGHSRVERVGPAAASRYSLGSRSRRNCSTSATSSSGSRVAGSMSSTSVSPVGSSSSSSTSDSRRLTYSTRSSSSAIRAATRASYSAAPLAKTSTGAGLPISRHARSTRARAAFGDGICGGVLRHRGPQRRRRDAGGRHGVVEHADDAGGALVARALQVVAVDQLGVARRPDDLHRPAVRHVGEQGAHADGQAGPGFLGEADELAAEQLPAQRRLGAEHEQHVAARHRRPPHPDRRPHDRAAPVVDPHVRAGSSRSR